MKDFAQWEGFEGSRWKEQINVRDFIRHNYTPYDGDDSFLEGPTEATDKLWGKLQELQKERGAQIAELQAEKCRLVDAKVLPYKAEAEQRMRDMAQQQHAQAMQQLKSPEERDKEMLDAAPKALNNALSIIDREIDKQQEKNDSLKKQINQDIESQAVKLAHERGYTIVFNKFRVNMKAEDITAAIIKALKKA